MHKLLIASAAVLAAVLLGLPRAVGSLTEARVRERVADIDASTAAAAALKSYERGWFTSTASIDLTLVPDDVAALAANGAASGNPFLGSAPLPIVVEFAHGPLAVLDGLYFGWSKMLAHLDHGAAGITELEQTLGVPYIFEFRGRTSYAGNFTFDADAPAFVLPIDEALLTFSGGVLSGTFGGRHLRADAQIGELEFDSSGGTLTIEQVTATADTELRSEYVMPGKASLSVGRLAVNDARGGTTPTFEVKNLRVASDTTLDATGTLLDLQVDYELESARMEQSALTGVKLGTSVRNLDVAVLDAYAAALRTTAGPGSDPTAALAAIGPEIERALRASPSIALDPIRFRFADEPFEGRIELTADAASLPQAGTLDIGNPLLMLGLLSLRAEARLSKPLARQMATLAAQLQLAADASLPPDQLAYLAEAQAGLMLTMLTAQGALLEDGNEGYRSSLELAAGRLTLNGNPLPFGLR